MLLQLMLQRHQSRYQESDMSLIVVVLRKRCSIKNCRYLSSRSAGYLKPLQNKDAGVLEEQGLGIAIDFTQQHFFQRWINIVIQRL